MRRVRLGALFIAAVFLTAGNIPSVQAARGTHEAPKIMNLWFDWEMPDSEMARLAQWDVVVLDGDQQARYPEKIRRLRELNPNIKILAYIDASTIASARFVEESWFPGYALAHSIPESWYLHRGRSRVSNWPGSWMLNMTDRSPTDAQGRRWNDYLPEFIHKELWSTGLWDGIFLDNALENATYFGGSNLDITNDGIAESNAEVDRLWKEGWKKMARNLRTRLGPNALIMGNGHVDYADVTNGILFENFPRYGWSNTFRDYQTAVTKNQKPTITAINSNPNNANNPGDYQLMRYTLGATLMADGYYSFDFGDRDHGQTWWYDEYDAALGAPIGGTATLQEGVLWRDYANGGALINSKNSTVTVALPGVYERLRGAQVPSVNNGALETSITLAAQDGIVLHRRLGESSLPAGTAFRSGDFVRVYHADGSQPRAGFFAQHTGAPGGATVVTYDVDRDGTIDTLIGTNGQIRITYGNGRTAILRPFGAGYTGSLTLAVGNTDWDDPWEIATADNNGEVRIVELNGTIRAGWRPYASFRGTISVAIGDLDGDGLREVATGAGPGGGPHVRVFKTDGLPWRGGWFAFDARERGGVFVAIADMDKDGTAELITGSGEQTIPRMRLWRAKEAEMIREFTLGTSASAPGIRPSITDLDGDGTLELLAAGIQVGP